MNRKEPTKTFMLISNGKMPLVSMFYMKLFYSLKYSRGVSLSLKNRFRYDPYDSTLILVIADDEIVVVVRDKTSP